MACFWHYNHSKYYKFHKFSMRHRFFSCSTTWQTLFLRGRGTSQKWWEISFLVHDWYCGLAECDRESRIISRCLVYGYALEISTIDYHRNELVFQLYLCGSLKLFWYPFFLFSSVCSIHLRLILLSIFFQKYWIANLQFGP